MHGKGLKVMSSLQCNNYNPEGPSYFRALAAVFILAAVFLFGCSISSDERSEPRTTKEGVSMAQTPKNTSSTAPIPPIDAVAYARVETATFALG
jgi:Na+/H+ antiporter NhaC